MTNTATTQRCTKRNIVELKHEGVIKQVNEATSCISIMVTVIKPCYLSKNMHRPK